MKRQPYVKSNEKTLSIREAMDITDVSRFTIYNWMKKDYFDYHRKINGYVLINKESFLRFVESKMEGLNNE